MCLQIYELDSFKVTHASKYPGPVLSLGLSPDCALLAVGQADGLLSIRKHSRPKAVPVEAGEHGLLVLHVYDRRHLWSMLLMASAAVHQKALVFKSCTH